MSTDPLFKYLQLSDNLSKELYLESSREKEYGRFAKIVLPEPKEIGASFTELVLARESIKEFGAGIVTIQQMSDLLYWSAGLSEKKEGGETKRAYASGGAKYPLSIYLYILKNCELKQGFYCYEPSSHSLRALPTLEVFQFETIAEEEWVKGSSFMTFFTYRKSRSFKRYTNLAYKNALIETGLIMQNMYLISTCLQLGCCALGKGSRSKRDIEEIFLMDADESLVCRMGFGALR